MDRRAFLQRAALIAAGTVAANQLELLERLTHRRRFFPSAAVSHIENSGFYGTPTEFLYRYPDGLTVMSGSWGIYKRGELVARIPSSPPQSGDIMRITVAGDQFRFSVGGRTISSSLVSLL